MGAIKQHFHQELCEQANDRDDYGFDLAMEAERAEDIYMALLARMPDAYHRSKEQQREIDDALGAKLRATYAVRHYG